MTNLLFCLFSLFRCLGNIAGDGAELRDLVLSFNALNPLAMNVAQPANLALLRNCTWALSNFCRGKPQPPLQVLAPALPILAQIVFQNPDQDTVIGKSRHMLFPIISLRIRPLIILSPRTQMRHGHFPTFLMGTIVASKLWWIMVSCHT